MHPSLYITITRPFVFTLRICFWCLYPSCLASLIIMAQPAPSSSPFTYTYTHDVFLSFRGGDTRTGFTGNLYSALCQRGVLTFMDDAGLRKGEEITPSLLKAIQKSRMAIVIFSKNYASSTFCLNELVEVLECYTKEKGRWIWPVFYDVDPSEVRHQMGSFGEALAKHERGRFKDDIEKVKKWRLALGQAADLSGWHFKHGGEYEHVFIKRIMEEVSSKLNRPLLHVANYPVGLEAQMRDVQLLMNADSDNKVNMLGIYGIGGIGKSTIARAIFNLIADKFEGSCFLANVREKSIGHGLVQIQETMLSQLVGEKNIKLGDVNQGIPILKERLHLKKVLLILDDVDKMEQLQATAGGLDWFGFGSFIIITTRDKHLLDIHGVEKLYEVNELNDTKALELFSWNAFKKNEVDPSFMEIINCAIHYASGLPLALETIGSNLFGKTLDEWKSALEAYERIPNRDVLEILRVSYDGLEENEKEIFLDIACFFKGCTMRYVTNMLYASGFHPKHGIRVLEKKSLIKVMEFGARDDHITVTMHDLIQYMGKEIVRQQSTWPDKRNRLWFCEDVIRVLEKNTENDEIEAMMLDMPEDKEVEWNQEIFRKMKNLRMLIKRTAGFFSSPKHLPNSLRVLEWWGYPSASLPSNFLPRNLVMLNLSHSCFQWDKPLETLKFLSHLITIDCEYIRQIPDVSGSPNLTELCVDYCINLTGIHDSFGFLDKLQRFSAKGCSKLSNIPSGIKSTSLEYLCLRDCSSLNIFPEILGPMEKLQFVDFDGTAIENLPLSVQNLGGLQNLSLSRCTMLNIKALLNIVQMLPNFFPFLELLDLESSNLIILPACIEECHFLKDLILNDCKQLREIRGLPPSLIALWAINCTSLNTGCSTLNMLLNRALWSTKRRSISLPGQRIPEWFDYSSRGHSLCFWFRKEFPAITVGVVFGFGEIGLHVKINNDTIQYLYSVWSDSKTYTIYLGNIISKLMFNKNRSLFLEHKWNQVEILFLKYPNTNLVAPVAWTGVYVNREITSMEDVRFTNPYPPKYTYGHSCYGNHDVRKQLTLLDNGLCEAPRINQQQVLLDSLYSTISGGCATVEYTQEDRAMYVEISHYHLPMVWKLPLNYVYRNSDLTRTIDDTNDLDRAVLDYAEKALGESSQAPYFAKAQNIQAPSPTSSSGKVSGEEIHLKANSTMLPTTIDETFNNQIELSQADVEMEAFYASLDAETHVLPHSHDKSIATAPIEEAKAALKNVQDLFSNDASVLLHIEKCTVLKTSLDYLSNLSADDGISREMRTLILEASRVFTHWSWDYSEASMKIKSTASELLRADELEADLEDNKKQFREVVALENELLQKLAYMEESKKELEEQINAIKADISASQSDKNMTHMRKRHIFEEGKTFKTKMDELREKVPRLQHEQGLAKKTQAKITDEWSKLGEKFKNVAEG